MRSSFLGVTLAAIITLSTSVARASSPPSTSRVIVVIGVGIGTSEVEERVRTAIGRELGVTTVASTDPRAASAMGQLTIDVRSSTKTLTVTFRKIVGDAAPSAQVAQVPAVARTIPLPDDAVRVESSAVILASNVARDDADDVLSAITHRPRATWEKTLAPAGKGPEKQQPESWKESVTAYEKGAQSYRDTVSAIIKLHYETKKKDILSGLDREIDNEKAQLSKARETAIHRLEVLGVLSYPEPSKSEIDDAIRAAIEARDSKEDDTYLDNAAFFVVDLSDVDRDLAYMRFVQTNGVSGIEKRIEVKFDSSDPTTRKVVRDAIPPALQKSIKAREEYIRIVPANRDTQKRGLEYRYWIAETYFLYGQWDQAKPRFEALWKERCGVDGYGFKAWTKLVTMAAKERDEVRALELSDAVDPRKGGKSCDNAEGASERAFTDPIQIETTYARARKKFEDACGGGGGGKVCTSNASVADLEKKAMWREAAALYERALEAGPTHEDAPIAAMNAAFAYKQVGAYDKAIVLYNKCINEYGGRAQLEALRRGDQKTKTAPNPKAYADRIAYLSEAYEALGTTYYSLFDYQRAAETYEGLAESDRFDEAKRRRAAKNAMILYGNVGQGDAMLKMHRVLERLRPTAEDKAEADFRVASFEAKKWDASVADRGTNRQSRLRAEDVLTRYFETNRSNASAARFLVEAAYTVAKMKHANGGAPERQRGEMSSDEATWLRNTVRAWDMLKATDAGVAQREPLVDYAAEASFTLIDDAIASTFDTPDKHQYPATASEVLGMPGGTGVKKGKYVLNAEEAKKWTTRLETEVIKKYTSLEWVVAAVARQGAIFDTLRSGLYFNTTKTRLFTADGEKLLQSLRSSGREARADELEDTAKDVWRQRKQRELDDADEVMIDRYATAVAYARKFSVKNAAVTKALSRLAHYTDVIGDAKMRKYVESTPDPTDSNVSNGTKGVTKLSYTSNMYVQSRPGIPSTSQSDPKPLPAMS